LYLFIDTSEEETLLLLHERRQSWWTTLNSFVLLFFFFFLFFVDIFHACVLRIPTPFIQKKKKKKILLCILMAIKSYNYMNLNNSHEVHSPWKHVERVSLLHRNMKKTSRMSSSCPLALNLFYWLRQWPFFCYGSNSWMDFMLTCYWTKNGI
jgi:hypothetical protein